MSTPLLRLSIVPDDPLPIYAQIMNEIRRVVAAGLVAPDEMLPSVRQLTRDLQVNPLTIKQAYDALEREGLVYVRRGVGTFVSPRAASPEQRGVAISAVVDRAVQDAHRHGIAASELLAALSARVGAHAQATPNHAVPERAAPEGTRDD